ncbi:hypothetical protein [Sessilibacter corallicola]|uniref:Uncharacterized protein n=1 Tax=Sessilibacter corallicola TaxID=2904075 RepID=A0ABQ0AF46_9GAMM
MRLTKFFEKDMSVLWIIIGTIFQLMLSMFIFMLAAVVGGSFANGNNLSESKLKVLNLSLFVLPGLCIVAAGIVIYQFFSGGTNNSYFWYGLPIIGVMLYFIFLKKF